MVAVTPPPPPPPVIDGQVRLPATAVIVDPPKPVTQLPISTVLTGAIVGKATAGQVPVETVHGRILLQTPIPLPDDGVLELQIQRTQPSLTVLIRSLNGQALPSQSDLGRPNLLPPAPDAQSGLASPKNPGNPIGANPGPNAPATRTGSLIPGSTSTPNLVNSVPSGVTAQPLRPGQVLQVKLIRPPEGLPSTEARNAPPASFQAVASGKGEPVTLNVLTNGAAATTPSIAASPKPQSANAGAQGQTPERLQQPIIRHDVLTTVRVISMGGQDIPAFSTPTPSQSGNRLSGTVIGTRPGGQPLIETNAGLLSLETSPSVKAGAEITLEVLASNNRTAANTSFGTNFAELLATQQWPSLNETLRQLSETAPAATQQLANNTLPRANTQLATNILFFLTALRGGDVRQWLGNNASRILERDRPDLLQRLGDDFGSMSRTYNEPNEGRTALVPFLNGEQLEQVRMFTRGGRGGDEGDEDSPTRFIIDVELSSLGRVQMDGFVRSKGKRFDLILRSDQPLPGVMRREITRIFTQSAEVTGVAGQLLFLADASFVDIAAQSVETPAFPEGMMV